MTPSNEGEKMGKKLIVVLILVIVLAVAAFAAYTLFIKENTAKSL